MLFSTISLLIFSKVNKIIFEVKYNNYLPNIIKELIQGIPMTRISMSKFVLSREKKGDV